MSVWVLPVPKGTPISQVFGQLLGRPAGECGPGGHPGTDYACPQGTPVRAASAGVVSYAGPASGFGNHAVSIYHPADDVTTTYGHMMTHNYGVGAAVAAGDVIGLADTEGEATGPHLHFELRPGTRVFGAYPPNIDGDAWLHQHGAYHDQPTGEFLVNMPTIDSHRPLNMQAPAIRTAQALLGARGGFINCNNGSHAVFAAVLHWFQVTAGLVDDGVIGDATWHALGDPHGLGGH